MKIIKSFKSLTKFEICLWVVSLAGVICSAFIGNFKNPLETCASIIGVTALIFVAKGNVLGQILTVVFSLFYGYISFVFHYYGEMITYTCMSAPIAAMAVVSWIKNPYDSDSQEVRVNHLKMPEILILFGIAAVVTVIFYFILRFFNTENLVLSTVSVTTSFIAAYLTFRRSRFYGLAYAANDVVLIGLWVYAAFFDIRYISMVICFVMFLANDIYGCYNWSRMRKRQADKDR